MADAEKGFMFTLLVAVLFFLMLLSVRAYVKSQQMGEELAAVGARADAVRNFVESAQADFYRMSLLAGYRAVNISGTVAVARGAFLDDANSGIHELYWNATLDGNGSYTLYTINHSIYDEMDGAVMRDWVDRLGEKAGRYGLVQRTAESAFIVGQDKPFEVSIHNALNYSVDDVSGVLAFDQLVLVSDRNFSIEGFEDPTHALNSTRRLRRFVHMWPYPPDYQFVSVIAETTTGAGSGWVYDEAEQLGTCCNENNCNDTTLDPPNIDPNTIMVANQVEPLLANCPSKVNQFRGLIAKECPSSPINLSIPYVCNFTINVTDPNVIADGTPVLLNNRDNVHEVLDIENLRDALGAGYYREGSMGPSYLSRLEGRYDGSTGGIESLMKPDQVGTENRSWVDYYFLSGTPCTALPSGCFRVKGTVNCENASRCNDDSLQHLQLDNELVFANGSTIRHLEYYYVENISCAIGSC